MSPDPGNSLLKVPFGIAPADYRGPFLTAATPRRAADLLLINTGATALEVSRLQEPRQKWQRTVTLVTVALMLISGAGAAWLTGAGHPAAASAVPFVAALLIVSVVLAVSGKAAQRIRAKQVEIAGISAHLTVSPLVPGQARRSLGADIADYFQDLPGETDDETERQLRFELAHWLLGYARKYGTANESAGILDLMNAEGVFSTLRALRRENGAPRTVFR